jgi:hypothetical protein
MDNDKEKQEISLIGRIFSLEALLVVMGILSLASGLVYSDGIRVFLGIAAIICGSLLFLFVRKKYLEK